MMSAANASGAAIAKGSTLTANVRYIEFTVPGQPIPKARARVVRGHAFTPETTAGHESVIVAEARNAGVRGEPDAKAQWEIVCWFYRKGQRRADLDNLLKTVLDALNGVVWADDNQIVAIKAYKRREDKLPRTLIEIREVRE